MDIILVLCYGNELADAVLTETELLYYYYKVISITELLFYLVFVLVTKNLTQY